MGNQIIPEQALSIDIYAITWSLNIIAAAIGERTNLCLKPGLVITVKRNFHQLRGCSWSEKYILICLPSFADLLQNEDHCRPSHS